MNFTKYNVIKMPRVFQSVFYLLGYKREEICERDTNKLEWKKAKHVLLGGDGGDGTEFFRRIGDYHIAGAKDESFKAYQKLKFLKRNIKKHETQPEQVDEYSIALGRLFKWLLFSIEMRINDVISRREHKFKLKEERKVSEEAFAERERLRNEALEIAKAVSLLLFQLHLFFRSMKIEKMSVLQQLREKTMIQRRRDATLMRSSICVSGTLTMRRSTCLLLLSTTLTTTTMYLMSESFESSS